MGLLAAARRHRRYGECADPRPRWAARSTRRLTPRRSTMRSSSWRQRRHYRRSAAASDVQVPSDARVIDCTGKTVVAGFWNSHVHFTEAVWKDAGNAPAAPLTAHMQEMLTRWGFTSSVEFGSSPAELAGAAPPRLCGRNPRSRIFSSSAAFSPRMADRLICQPRAFPRRTRRSGRRRWPRYYLQIGLDGIKLFTGSYKGEDKPVVNMEAAIARPRSMSRTCKAGRCSRTRRIRPVSRP